MTNRHTADSITSDALDALYDEIDRLRAGEEDGYDPLAVPTPGQWIHQFNQATAEKRLEVVGRMIDAAERVWACTMNGHEERIHDGRHAEMALNEVRQVVADMENTTGARTWAGWLRDAMKRGPKHCLLCATEPKTGAACTCAGTDAGLNACANCPTPWPDIPGANRIRPAATEATEPHTGLVVQPYRNDRGENAWVFRCWGTDDGCDGWLSLDHYSEQSATRARDRHVTEEHPSEEQR